MVIDVKKLRAIDYTVTGDYVMVQFEKTDKSVALEAIDLFNTFSDFKSVEYETEGGYHFVTGNLKECK
jgi:hypothetical protein